ncbi:uncharacterized protein SCHCODRAFT_01151902 [Schizophyllum commune H4-8]|nr:uncharacterized protein SCHCODRAFT_01151902 [Schizophyllum commune H4-8]KAI5891988.1 hypothetical protein SCHCODRAFT_01151902 [Schizophyllum commune H4-8]
MLENRYLAFNLEDTGHSDAPRHVRDVPMVEENYAPPGASNLVDALMLMQLNWSDTYIVLASGDTLPQCPDGFVPD